MRCLVVIVVVLTPSLVEAQTTPIIPTGQVNEVNVTRLQLVYHPLVRGQPAAARDFLFLDRAVRVTIDGRPAQLDELRAGYLFTYRNGSTGRVLTIDAQTPAAIAAVAAKREAAHADAAFRARQATVATLSRAKAAEYARRLDAMWAAQRAAAARNSPRPIITNQLGNVPSSEPAFPPGPAVVSSRPVNPRPVFPGTRPPRPTFYAPPPSAPRAEPTEGDFQAAAVKIATAALAHIAGDYIANGGSDDFADALARVFLSSAIKFGRDELIAGAVHDLFPRLDPRARRGVQIIISLILDNQFTVGNIARDAAIEVIKDRLSRYDVEAGAAAEVAHFLYVMHETWQRTQSGR